MAGYELASAGGAVPPARLYPIEEARSSGKSEAGATALAAFGIALVAGVFFPALAPLLSTDDMIFVIGAAVLVLIAVAAARAIQNPDAAFREIGGGLAGAAAAALIATAVLPRQDQLDVEKALTSALSRDLSEFSFGLDFGGFEFGQESSVPSTPEAAAVAARPMLMPGSDSSESVFSPSQVRVFAGGLQLISFAGALVFAAAVLASAARRPIQRFIGSRPRDPDPPPKRLLL